MTEIIFLGTSSMQPTKNRNHPSILIIHKGDHILMDCGEGTQRQLKIAGIKFNKISKILISHWHGDHVLGLPGLLSSMNFNDYNKTLNIYGPKGTKKYFNHVKKAFLEKCEVKVKINEIKKKTFFKSKEYNLEAISLNHGLPTLGFSFIENDKRRIKASKIKEFGIKPGPLLGKLQSGKSITLHSKRIKSDDVTYKIKGKKITYIPDTSYCKNAIELAKDSDLLISESSFSSVHKDKAIKYKHMTSSEAAQLAELSNSQKLVLTHFSQRYEKDLSELEDEAKSIFKKTESSYDFMKIKL